ncbi:hypothetical protein C4544_05180 [candidate division WS5 bacterium]|uniref:Bacteriophage Mu GpT domain-containing protein n=1 Tax=candidate division WS5 bacterium TaxID=2093353 RepID=A0A419DB57_9BACT|nr:MAG: hypothetical protein C4544_05180 [candidate division WS5 bacterium]
MSAPLTIGQASDLVDLSIQKIFLKTSEPENQYKKYFNFRKTEDYYEKDSGLSGLGESDFADENGVIMSDIPVQTYDKTYTQEMVSKLLSITYKMWKFGIKKRDLENITADLRKTDLRKREKLCAERLINSFETTSYTHNGQSGNKTITVSGGDGLGVIDDDHTREDGGTNMNNYVYDGTTYNLPFGYAGLKAAHTTASAFVDPRGNPMPASLDTLVCKKASSVAFKAKEILKAIQNSKIPESNDNDGAGTPAFKILELDYLTQDARWWMFDGSRMDDRNGFQFIESEAVTIDPVNVVYKTKEIQVSSHSLFDLGHNDCARSWVGSKGDSSNPTS